jgi:hypothetical protein
MEGAHGQQPAPSWDKLREALSVLKTATDGAKLEIFDSGESARVSTQDYFAGMRRWALGQTRTETIAWVRSVVAKCERFDQHYRAVWESESNRGFSGAADPCPQCQRAACSCTSRGLLVALAEDCDEATRGLRALARTYRSHPICCNRGKSEFLILAMCPHRRQFPFVPRTLALPGNTGRDDEATSGALRQAELALTQVALGISEFMRAGSLPNQ